MGSGFYESGCLLWDTGLTVYIDSDLDGYMNHATATRSCKENFITPLNGLASRCNRHVRPCTEALADTRSPTRSCPRFLHAHLL